MDGNTVGSIGLGLLAFVAVLRTDTPDDAAWIRHKLLSLRVFPDADGKLNLSIREVGGSLLLVSQFTLAADIGKGARPSFQQAMEPREAKRIFDALVGALRADVPVETGQFGAEMAVELTNSGPVTLWLDSAQARRPGDLSKDAGALP